jgi:protein-tyrosine-phosphatase
MSADIDPGSAPLRVAFVCVQNAGRSQMSAAFAERERRQRGLQDAVEVLTGGTHPAERVHQVVVDVMAEEGFDLSDRAPHEITTAELASCDYVATMGCSTLDLGGTGDRVEVRDWALPDPDGEDLEDARAIRETVRERVATLFDDVESDLESDE